MITFITFIFYLEEIKLVVSLQKENYNLEYIICEHIIKDIFPYHSISSLLKSLLIKKKIEI